MRKKVIFNKNKLYFETFCENEQQKQCRTISMANSEFKKEQFMRDSVNSVDFALDFECWIVCFSYKQQYKKE